MAAYVPKRQKRQIIAALVGVAEVVGEVYEQIKEAKATYDEVNEGYLRIKEKFEEYLGTLEMHYSNTYSVQILESYKWLPYMSFIDLCHRCTTVDISDWQERKNVLFWLSSLPTAAPFSVVSRFPTSPPYICISLKPFSGLWDNLTIALGYKASDNSEEFITRHEKYFEKFLEYLRNVEHQVITTPNKFVFTRDVFERHFSLSWVSGSDPAPPAALVRSLSTEDEYESISLEDTFMA